MNERRNPDFTGDRNPNLTDDIETGRGRSPAALAAEEEGAALDPDRTVYNPGTTPPERAASSSTAGGKDSLASDPETTNFGATGRQADEQAKAQSGTGVLHPDPRTSTGTTGERSMDGGSSSDGKNSGEATTLLPGDKAENFSQRWTDIQTTFVDEPKTAVRNADGLVSEVIQELSSRFAQERQGLEQQWSGGGDVSTEDLRMALRHYRDFFQRLLAA